MEEILGAHNDDAAFDRYLANWRAIMESRIVEATERIANISGIRGLILAGSNGLGNPWPLSDIDLIPIYDASRMNEATEEVEEARLAILDEWSVQGWRTGLDIGRLKFSVHELKSIFDETDHDPLRLLRDDRWYHSIDKAYRGRPLIDSNGLASSLVNWFTANRFVSEVANLRVERSTSEARASLVGAQTCLADHDLAVAYGSLLKSIQWKQISLMERWGERDNSLGRFGTRFHYTASGHGLVDVSNAFNILGNLDIHTAQSRMTAAPLWVHERNDRSWKARSITDEAITPSLNMQDVLRVCTMYQLRIVSGMSFPEWLAIPTENELRERVAALESLYDELDKQKEPPSFESGPGSNGNSRWEGCV